MHLLSNLKTGVKAIFLKLRPLLIKVAPVIFLTRYELNVLLKPWYHNYEVFGVKTPQRGGFYLKNQVNKQGPLFDLIDKAITLCKKNGTSVKGLDLFCADGFFSNFAILRGATSIDAIDWERSEIEQARLITYLLGNSKSINYIESNVFSIENAEKVYDFGICAGGLYHIHNPQELLVLLRKKVKIALVVQTVYSLANSAPDYFEVAYPDRPWGSRFSYDYVLNIVEEAGWTAIEVFHNELEGNDRLEDRGSVYLLCVPTQ
ncbi:MAG: hypothetical protein BGO39_28995 [Chloroflexi bacterium 54-19]|nr:MAG: hypothetical protein BGO39_28995 [Chloroflexi bacterium 54-19]